MGEVCGAGGVFFWGKFEGYGTDFAVCVWMREGAREGSARIDDWCEVNGSLWRSLWRGWWEPRRCRIRVIFTIFLWVVDVHKAVFGR